MLCCFYCVAGGQSGRLALSRGNSTTCSTGAERCTTALRAAAVAGDAQVIPLAPRKWVCATPRSAPFQLHSECATCCARLLSPLLRASTFFWHISPLASLYWYKTTPLTTQIKIILRPALSSLPSSNRPCHSQALVASPQLTLL